MRGQIHFRDCVVMVLIGLTACCATALMGCSGSGDSADSTESADPEVPGETGSPTAAAAPVVVLSPDDWRPPTPTQADILADRILREEDDSLLLDPTERRQLAAEIDSVLSSIRDAYPAFADITVRMPYAFGELLVGLEPQLFDEVASLLEEQTGPVTLRTGYAAFDSLNADLELSVVVDLFPSFHAVTLYFSEHLNVPAAAAAYGMVDGVEYAESNTYVGDGPDTHAVKSHGRWYVVARHAEGDCPAGCIAQELFFFVVDGAAVEMLDSEQALEIPEFMALVMNRGW